MNELVNYSDKGIEFALKHGPSLLLAILTLVIGLWIIRIIGRTFGSVMDKRAIDPNLKPFLKSLVSILLKILLVISIMEIIGIKMTSFIAILGAAGLAIGMALSGTLQNFAGGAIILLFKPFKIGDYIETSGYSGTVKAIQIFNTILTTPDNKTIIIPNGGLSTSSLINYSTELERRVEFIFGIGYDDDIDKAKDILKSIIHKNQYVLTEPEPFIAVKELADSSVNFIVRAWVKSPDYWNLYFEIPEKVKKAFDKEGISIPYPQRDIHVHNK